METKTAIWIGIFAGSIVGGLIGSALDKGNVFGTWGIVLSTMGALAGIWAGYKIANG